MSKIVCVIMCNIILYTYTTKGIRVFLYGEISIDGIAPNLSSFKFVCLFKYTYVYIYIVHLCRVNISNFSLTNKSRNYLNRTPAAIIHTIIELIQRSTTHR